MEFTVFIIFLCISAFFMIYGLLSRALVFLFIAMAFQSIILWNLYSSPELVRIDTFSFVNNQTGQVEVYSHKVNLVDSLTINMLRLVIWSFLILTIALPLVIKS